MSTNLTPDDVIDLLTLMSAYDQRETGPEDVRAWLMIADLERWDREVVKRIVLDHYRAGADKRRLTPAAVSDRHRELRRSAAATFEDPVLPDDFGGLSYPAWYRAQRDAHVARLMAMWATTGDDMPLAIEGRSDPEVRHIDRWRA
jgi:hypothetical protein